MCSFSNPLSDTSSLNWGAPSLQWSKVSFRVLAQQWRARVGELTLNGITIRTPVFMPVGTKATIKGIPLEWMRKEYLWTSNNIRLILGNTFHLFLHPWPQTIAQAGWVHKFQSWDGLILTDSWWYQLFSLWLSKLWKPLAKLHDHGVTFRSPYDGSSHLFTPTNVIDTQRSFGSDIMMMLDVCSPVHDTSKRIVAQHMAITHQRASQAYNYHMEEYNHWRWALFPIIQGWLYHDLREESARTLSQYANDGIAIGGLSVGEWKDAMYQVLQDLNPHLPNHIPRYLMWVGTPEDIRMAIYQGIDMFDCVMPTRLWRHWWAFTRQWTVALKKWIYKNDLQPLDNTCRCMTCSHYTRSYIHHLIKEGEMLWGMLLSLHNIAFLQMLIEEIQNEILHN
jgi:queuine tRNA-ribosyltransferase